MRDRAMTMPVAVVALSPVTDLTLSGETYFTLREADPILPNPESMKEWSSAYAKPSEQRFPYASPLYGNFSKGFLPTLIEVGTKEVRLGLCYLLIMSFEYHEPLTFAFDLNVIPRSILFTESRKSKPEGLFYIAYTITLIPSMWD